MVVAAVVVVVVVGAAVVVVVVARVVVVVAATVVVVVTGTVVVVVTGTVVVVAAVVVSGAGEHTPSMTVNEPDILSGSVQNSSDAKKYVLGAYVELIGTT